jgi:hypothetical protein
MRWKIIIVNSIIVLVVGLVAYGLMVTALGDAVTNSAERKAQVEQTLQSANSQLALDGLRLERWLAEQAGDPVVRGVFSAGTAAARSEAATTQANRIRDAAVNVPDFARIAPSLVLFVDKAGVAIGRNGSTQLRGDAMGEAYPSIAAALKSGHTTSDVWVNRDRQEQMLSSYAPVRGDDGAVAGLVIVGTPLNDTRLSRTSELTSGATLMLGIAGQAGVETVAKSATASAALIAAANAQAVRDAATAAAGSGNVTVVADPVEGHVFGAAPLAGYGDGRRAVVLAAVPRSLVGSVSGLLWPIFAVTALGILLVCVGGFVLGNYVQEPISEIEEGLLAIINGNTNFRFELEHAELGGLVFRINSLLNALMGVPETDEEGRPSRPASAQDFQEALSVDESQAASAGVDPQVARALAAEPADRYYARLFSEYIAAKKRLGDPTDHITQEAFASRLQASEMEMAQKHGRPVRYQVQLRDNGVVLIAVPMP